MTIEQGPPSPGQVTQLLRELRKGNRAVEVELMPAIYDEIHRLAGNYMRGERCNHTLQATALVNEAYMRLVEQRDIAWESRAHFFAVAAQVMRRILVDHARARQASKRGGARFAVTLDDGLLVSDERSVEMLDLDEALDRLIALDPQLGRVVELRFFGGLSVEETAAVMDISPKTVKRNWALARAWLHGQLATPS